MGSFNRIVNRKNTHSYKWEVLKKYPNGEDIIPLSVADSEYRAPNVVQKTLIKRIKHGVFGYTKISESYKENMKTWFLSEYGYSIEKEWIIPMSGVVNAMSFAIQLYTGVKDQIVVQPPVYPPFFRIVEENHRELVTNCLLNNQENYSIDFDDLEKAFQQGAKMLIFCSPHNPVGRVYTYQEVEKVVKLCKAYDVVLLSDEIHCDLILGDSPFVSVGHFIHEYEKIIICTAPSKTFNIAGLHVGNVILANESMRKDFEKFLYSHSLYGANLLGLVAAETVYTKGSKWVHGQRAYLRNNYQTLYAFMKTYIPEAAFPKIEGTYLAWINMRFLKQSCKELFEGLISYGVYVNCGNDYCKDYEGYIRLNLACPRKMLDEGLRRLGKYVGDHRPIN